MNISFESNKDAKCKFGYVGVPWDQGDVNGTPGSRMGPDAIRKFVAKVVNNIRDNKLLDCERWEMLDTSDLLVKDFGNCNDYRFYDWDYSTAYFADEVRKACEAGFNVMVAGGDCGINYVAAKGLHDSFDGNMGVIYMDAHLDVWEGPDLLKQGQYSHSSPLLNIAHLDRVKGDNIVHFGSRGYRSTQATENYAFMTSRNMNIITYAKFRADGVEKTVQNMLDTVTKGTDKVALCIDIDVFEQAIAPGSSANEPCGPDSYEMHELLKRLAPHIDCMCITEVNPIMDKNEQTPRRAGRMYLDYIFNKYAPMK
ncbi:MAG: arginase family protein [Bacillota bacterium]|nr:arginase family protein [Bacillota bacterium]